MERRYRSCKRRGVLPERLQTLVKKRTAAAVTALRPTTMTKRPNPATSASLLDGLLGLVSRLPLHGPKIRDSYLRHLISATGAAAGWVIPIRKGRLRRREAHQLGDSQLTLPSRIAEDCLAQAEDVVLDSELAPPAGPIWRVRLRYENRPQCVVLLGGVADSASGSDLMAASPLLAFIEYSLKLAALVQGSRRDLERLAENSQLLAGQNRRLFEELSTHRQRLQSVSKGVIRMQEEERSKISRELHDGIGQALTALKINLDLLGSEIDPQLGEESRRRFETTRGMAAECLREVRELSRLLRPRMLDDLGLSATLRWLVRSFEERTGLMVDLEDELGTRRLEPEVETLLFRVTQEALNNIVKHAETEKARVTLRRSEGGLELEISDRGRGFDAAAIQADALTGSGLRGIYDRVALAGGEFCLDSAHNKGTRLTIRVPDSAPSRRAKGDPV